jgi:hypothetical protein
MTCVNKPKRGDKPGSAVLTPRARNAMGMDLLAGEFQLSLNWMGWHALQDLLAAHGFSGQLPESNDGEMVSHETAQGVAEAMLPYSTSTRVPVWHMRYC